MGWTPARRSASSSCRSKPPSGPTKSCRSAGCSCARRPGSVGPWGSARKDAAPARPSRASASGNGSSTRSSQGLRDCLHAATATRPSLASRAAVGFRLERLVSSGVQEQAPAWLSRSTSSPARGPLGRGARTRIRGAGGEGCCSTCSRRTAKRRPGSRTTRPRPSSPLPLSTSAASPGWALRTRSACLASSSGTTTSSPSPKQAPSTKTVSMGRG